MVVHDTFLKVNVPIAMAQVSIGLRSLEVSAGGLWEARLGNATSAKALAKSRRHARRVMVAAR